MESYHTISTTKPVGTYVMKFVDRILFIYTTLFSVIILVMAFVNRQTNGGGMVLFLLFLPVLGFLGLQIVQGIYQRRYGVSESSEEGPSELEAIKQKYQEQEFVPLESLRLKYFFQQRTPSFLFTMALLSIATSATLLRAGMVMFDTGFDFGGTSTEMIWPIPTES